MRILSLPINDDLLEVHNSMWSGEEMVYFNGHLASSGASLFGRSHYFTVDSPDGDGVDKYRVEIGMSWFGGVTIDVFRNDAAASWQAPRPPLPASMPACLREATPSPTTSSAAHGRKVGWMMSFLCRGLLGYRGALRCAHRGGEGGC